MLHKYLESFLTLGAVLFLNESSLSKNILGKNDSEIAESRFNLSIKNNMIIYWIKEIASISNLKTRKFEQENMERIAKCLCSYIFMLNK